MKRLSRRFKNNLMTSPSSESQLDPAWPVAKLRGCVKLTTTLVVDPGSPMRHTNSPTDS